MFALAACAEMLFRTLPIDERVRRIAGLGFAVATEYLRLGYEVYGTVRSDAHTPLHDLRGAGSDALHIERVDVTSTGEIAALRHRQWIVMNNDDRHRADIRVVADRLAKLLKAHRDLLAGRRPSTSG